MTTDSGITGISEYNECYGSPGLSGVIERVVADWVVGEDPMAVARIRASVRTPVASCESLFGIRGFRPYFEHASMDVAIVDVPWNGAWEGLKIAAMAEAHEVNVAPHNFYGHLSTVMSAHFCAAIPNFRVMEIDIDDVPWKDDLVTTVPEIEDGRLVLPPGPGWGTELNEEAIRAHPPLRPH